MKITTIEWDSPEIEKVVKLSPKIIAAVEGWRENEAALDLLSLLITVLALSYGGEPGAAQKAARQIVGAFKDELKS